MLTREEFNELIEKYNNKTITDDELNSLKPYKAKRAVFVAAGFGSRMVPITINTPKPLVRVRGIRIIDRLIDACIKAGIEDIVIVRGYLKEQFDQLLYKYPNIKFIDNDGYDKANNISSAFLAKDLLSNAYVLEADLVISNPDIITPYHYTSDFLAIKKESTDDWCFKVKDGVIEEELTEGGGEDIYQMVGISYWDGKAGENLKADLDKVFAREEGKNYYWEQVPLKHCKDNYRVEIRECLEEDIVEIDTFKELQMIDEKYKI